MGRDEAGMVFGFGSSDIFGDAALPLTFPDAQRLFRMAGSAWRRRAACMFSPRLRQAGTRCLKRCRRALLLQACQKNDWKNGGHSRHAVLRVANARGSRSITSIPTSKPCGGGARQQCPSSTVQAYEAHTVKIQLPMMLGGAWIRRRRTRQGMTAYARTFVIHKAGNLHDVLVRRSR